MNVHIPAIPILTALYIDRYNDTLAPKAHGAFLYQLRRLHRRRIEGYFIRPAAQHLPDGIDITDPAAYGKGNEHLLCRALYDIKHRASALVRSVDIQEGDLICAQLAVTPRRFYWVAGISDVFKLNAFDYATISYIQARNDSFFQHCSAPFSAKKLRRICIPLSPLFSG